jgi:hypothetical protein
MCIPGPARGPARQDVGHLEGHVHLRSGGPEDPPRRGLHSRRHDLGRVQDQLDIHPGTLTCLADILVLPGQDTSHCPRYLAFLVSVFDPVQVNQDRPRPTADRMIVAELTGEARHHARWRPLTGDEEAAAVAELRAIAGGRADLLAEVAGILEGTSEGELDEPLVRQAADLCRQAGADEDEIVVDRGRAAPGRERPQDAA